MRFGAKTIPVYTDTSDEQLQSRLDTALANLPPHSNVISIVPIRNEVIIFYSYSDDVNEVGRA